MANTRHKPELIVQKLRRVDVLVGREMNLGRARWVALDWHCIIQSRRSLSDQALKSSDANLEYRLPALHQDLSPTTPDGDKRQGMSSAKRGL